MRKSTWLPLAFAVVGIAFYVYYGIEYNAWEHNLANLVVYFLILVALHFVLRKKESYARRREEGEQ